MSDITLNLTNQSFPYDKLGKSYMLPKLCRKFAALSETAQRYKTQFAQHIDLSEDRSRDIIDVQTFNRLVSELSHASEDLKRLAVQSDQATFHSLCTSLSRLKDLVGRFKHPSIQSFADAVYETSQFLTSFPERVEVCAYLVDLSGTFGDFPSNDRPDVYLIPNLDAARSIIETEGDENSQVYCVYASYIPHPKGSYYIEADDMWHIKGHEIVKAYPC